MLGKQLHCLNDAIQRIASDTLWRQPRVVHQFLISIGLTSAKSKTIPKLKIPKEYYVDFLRGCFDGDGSFYSYFDPRWKSSFMFYISFTSASKSFIDWIRKENSNENDVKRKRNIFPPFFCITLQSTKDMLRKKSKKK